MIHFITKAIFQTLTLIALFSYLTLGSPSDGYNESDDLSYIGNRISGLPNRATGVKVSKWNESSGVNPEELGNYHEGDIIFPAEKFSGNAVAKETLLWPAGRVYYEISPEFDGEYLRQIKNAMKHISDRTCIRFVERTPDQQDYVKFTADDTGCWTTGIGRLEGEQVVNLQVPYCLRKLGSVVHEIMHVLGFGHEHNRPDRDQYIDILWQNIDNGYAKNFKKIETEPTTLGLPYDPYSIMHYSPNVFSTNKQLNTIQPKSSNVSLDQIGQRERLTPLDVQKIHKLYEKQCSL